MNNADIYASLQNIKANLYKAYPEPFAQPGTYADALGELNWLIRILQPTDDKFLGNIDIEIVLADRPD